MSLSRSTKSFGDIVASVDALEEYLIFHGVTIHANSGLGRSIARSRELLRLFEAGNIPLGYPHHEALDDLANISCLATVVLGSIDTAFESQVVERIHLLKAGEPGPLTPGPRSRERDLVFELVCAYTCSRFAEDVLLAEPDVCCSLSERRWGIACKAVYGTPSSIARRIGEAVRQLEDAKIDHGLVAVQITNVFPHRKMYHLDPTSSEIISLRDVNSQGALFSELLTETTLPIEKSFFESGRRRVVQPHIEGIIFAVHTVGYHNQTRTVMGAVQFTPFRRVESARRDEFLRSFNDNWQGLAWPKSENTEGAKRDE